MPTAIPFQLGSISTGTLKIEDLLPLLAAALESINPKVYALAKTDIDAHQEGDRGYTAMEQVQDLLNESCPPFVYFGPHPGDGADFGFWPDWDHLEEERRYHEPLSKFWLDEDQCMVEFDSDYVTVKDVDLNILWSTV